MKKVCFALILALLVSSLTLSVLASGYVRFSGNCNVRTGPGLSYGKLGSVSVGSTLDYMGDYSYDDRGVCWYKVYYSGSYGWVSSMYATLYNNDSYNYNDYYDNYDEPDVPLVIQSGAYGEWKNSGDKLAMRVKVTNISRYQTVKAFEMHMYAEDVWGDRIYGETTYYYSTTTKTVRPGETVYCDYLYLPNRSRISRVNAGIKRVICTDGSIYEYDTVEYKYWDIH